MKYSPDKIAAWVYLLLGMSVIFYGNWRLDSTLTIIGVICIAISIVYSSVDKILTKISEIR